MDIPRPYINGFVIIFIISCIACVYAGIMIGYQQGKEDRDSIINIKYDNINTEIWGVMIRNGFTPTKEQKQNIETEIKQNHRKAGFRGDNK
jgi:hypothetical protein